MSMTPTQKRRQTIRNREPQMTVISLGAGTQSTMLYYMSSMGLIERADYAIFADPGAAERKSTYKYLKNVLMPWAAANNGIPIIWASHKNLYQDLINQENSTGQRFGSLPAFTPGKNGKKEGRLKRQCTKEYKIDIVDEVIRDKYGIAGTNKNTPTTRVMIGITMDEMGRMKHPHQQWKVHVYPFCGYETWNHKLPHNSVQLLQYERKTRIQVDELYVEMDLENPGKSACVWCPFQCDGRWQEMKDNPDQSDWKRATNVDVSIRHGSKKGIEQPVFLHRSLKPIDEVDFKKENQPALFDSCDSGYCGT